MINDMIGNNILTLKPKETTWVGQKNEFVIVANIYATINIFSDDKS
jgi:hypothetical protein